MYLNVVAEDAIIPAFESCTDVVKWWQEIEDEYLKKYVITNIER